VREKCPVLAAVLTQFKGNGQKVHVADTDISQRILARSLQYTGWKPKPNEGRRNPKQELKYRRFRYVTSNEQKLVSNCI